MPMATAPTPSDAPAPAAAPAIASPAAAPEGVLAKVQKYVDSIKARNAKLSEDNAKLRAQLQEARSSHSRIRRIPKAAPAAAN